MGLDLFALLLILSAILSNIIWIYFDEFIWILIYLQVTYDYYLNKLKNLFNARNTNKN